MLRNKHRNMVVATGLVFIAAIAVVILILSSNNEKNNGFPMWEQAVEKDTTDNVLIEFVGLNFDVYNGEDEIVINLENLTMHEISYGADFWIDYFSDGNWYTVYRPEVVQAYAISLQVNGKKESAYRIPDGLLDREGLYRICVADLGYCDIDIIIGMDEN